MIQDEQKYFHTILGSCHGVGFSLRGDNDLHICLTILTEDDGYWQPSKEFFSSHWLGDLRTVLDEASEYLAANHVRDKDYFSYTYKTA